MASDITFHALANIFPLLEGQQFRDLVEDIRVNGLREPIVLYEGAVLDGRNRLRACHAAQVGARFRTYDGRDPVAFVVSANLHRRHLEASQRAMIAAAISELKLGRGAPKKAGRRDRGGRLIRRPLKRPDRPHKARVLHSETVSTEIGASAAGRLLNVSGVTVALAKKVILTGVPELVSAVKSGEISVHPAAEIASLPAAQQQDVLRAGLGVVSVIGRETREARLQERRFARGGKDASAVAVFDHIKVGDGRPIGNVRIGEIRSLVGSLELVACVLRETFKFAANANSIDRVRDAISEKTLARIIEEARQGRAPSSTDVA